MTHPLKFLRAFCSAPWGKEDAAGFGPLPVLAALCLTGCVAQRAEVRGQKSEARSLPPLPVAPTSVPLQLEAVVVMPPPPPATHTISVSTPCQIRVSTDLIHWSDLSYCTNTLTVAATAAQMFYRGESVAHLMWDASADTVDGYKIYSGTNSGNYSQVIDVGISTEGYFRCQPGTNYFAAASYVTSGGNYYESDFSNEAVKVVTPVVLTIQ